MKENINNLALEAFSCLRGGRVWKMVVFDGGVGATWYYGHCGAFHAGPCSARGASWARYREAILT